jgi:hypothetical protein
VAPAGDVNGDGYADILIGGINFVRYYEGGWNNNAASPSPLWSFQTDQGASQLGTANTISTAGDVNNDGYSDVIVGAPNYLAPSDNGRAWMFLGSASGLSPTPSWTVTGGNTGARFGHAVAFAGDVNGDGYSDVILSDPFNSQVTTQNGKISIYYGNGGLGGRSFVSHQQSPQSTPARNVAPLGMIGTDLVLSFYGGGPIAAGHDGGALEIEVKPQLAPFNGTGTHLDAYGSLWYGSIFRGWYDAGIVAPLSTYKWRIRITGGRTPFFPHSRWWGMPDTSQTMTDFRSPCQGASWYRDLDGDGHGDPNVSSFSCQAPPGYSANGDDCDDTSAARYPGNPEICDALDNNCDALVDNAAPPAGSTQLGVTRSGLTATLSWSPLAGATSYDIVRGSLATLRSFAGNYTASVNGCLGNNSPGPTVSDTSVPPSGDANWYLIRGVNCGGGGSYDEGVASQSGARDAEIAASSSACP